MQSRTTDWFDLLLRPITTLPPRLGGLKTTPESVAGDISDLLASRDDPAARCGSHKRRRPLACLPGQHAELIHCGAALGANIAVYWWRMIILATDWLALMLAVFCGTSRPDGPKSGAKTTWLRWPAPFFWIRPMLCPHSARRARPPAGVDGTTRLLAAVCGSGPSHVCFTTPVRIRVSFLGHSVSTFIANIHSCPRAPITRVCRYPPVARGPTSPTAPSADAFMYPFPPLCVLLDFSRHLLPTAFVPPSPSCFAPLVLVVPVSSLILLPLGCAALFDFPSSPDNAPCRQV